MSYFAVKAKSFALYEAFKNDCEALGYRYCEEFMPFEEDISIKWLVFSDTFFPHSKLEPISGENLFALSPYGDESEFHGKLFVLEKDYGRALAYAKSYISLRCAKLRVGDIAIVWNTLKSDAIIARLDGFTLDPAAMFVANNNQGYLHAIPFKSFEQYKDILK